MLNNGSHGRNVIKLLQPHLCEKGLDAVFEALVSILTTSLNLHKCMRQVFMSRLNFKLYSNINKWWLSFASGSLDIIHGSCSVFLYNIQYHPILYNYLRHFPPRHFKGLPSSFNLKNLRFKNNFSEWIILKRI